MNTARRISISRPAGFVVVVGTVMSVCGLTMVAAGLYGLYESPGVGSARAAEVEATENAYSQPRVSQSVCACEQLVSRVELRNRIATANLTVVRPVPRQRRERFAGDGVGRSISQSDDRRNFLMRTAMAHWFQHQTSRNERSGYGAVEAIHAERVLNHA